MDNKYIDLKSYINNEWEQFLMNNKYSKNTHDDYIVKMDCLHDEIVDYIYNVFENNNKFYSFRMIDKFIALNNKNYDEIEQKFIY